MSSSDPAAPVPFVVNIPPEEVERMKRLIADTRLPDRPPVPGASWDWGVDLDWLKSLRDKWLFDYDWKAVEETINAFSHYTVPIEGVTVHFIHQRSARPDAVPLIMTHGWPGSFWEFHRIIPLLTSPPEGQQAFHVVVPSLPGFGFSSPPPRKGWTMADNARIFDHLMTGVLGYPSYTAEGGDWGSLLSLNLGTDRFSACKLVHVTSRSAGPTLGALLTLPFFLLPTSWRLWLYSKIYSEEELFDFGRAKQMIRTGLGYFIEQATRPCTIGFALNDSPVGLLAWIGEKYREWMDPDVVPHATEFILTTVSIYFLTQSFASSTVPYKEHSFEKVQVTTPLGLSRFPFDVTNSPESWVRATHRRVVLSRSHERGGHFPAYEVPEVLAGDLRELLRDQSGLFVGR